MADSPNYGLPPNRVAADIVRLAERRTRSRLGRAARRSPWGAGTQRSANVRWSLPRL